MHRLLPDPRCYAPAQADPFVALALKDPPDAVQRARPSAALVDAYRDVLARNDEEAIAESLRHAPSACVARRLWLALDLAVQPAPGADALALRIFALPLLVVTGGRAGATLPGALTDVQRVQQVLEGSGALGPSRNFGFGNALCSIESLRAIPSCRLHALQRDPSSGGAAALDLPPADIRTASDDEEVHLRFLAGAAVTPAGAPSFIETAAAVGTWGMPLTRVLADQLRADGLSVLPIARPPATLLAAQPIGSIAREELALQAFVSRALRRFRGEVGEPVATLAALASGVLGVRFASPFVEDRVSVHTRALHATEDAAEVGQDIVTLLHECGIARVEVLPGVEDDAAFARNPAAPMH
jgi:hypothetical protein